MNDYHAMSCRKRHLTAPVAASVVLPPAPSVIHHRYNGHGYHIITILMFHHYHYYQYFRNSRTSTSQFVIIYSGNIYKGSGSGQRWWFVVVVVVVAVIVLVAIDPVIDQSIVSHGYPFSLSFSPSLYEYLPVGQKIFIRMTSTTAGQRHKQQLTISRY